MMDREFSIDKLKICTFDGKAYNYSIDASAGTGKTYTIEQIVMKCIDEGISLRSILIVTYTEKATGELRDRIRQRIDEVLAKKELFGKPLKNEQLFMDARAELEQTDICTIHSFCQKTLRLFAYDSGRTITMNLVDDSNVGDLIDKMARDEWPKLDSFRKLLELSDNSGALVKDCKETIQNVLKSYYLRPDGSEDPEIVQLEKLEFHGHRFTIEEITNYYTKIGTEALSIFPGFKEQFSILSSNEDEPYSSKRIIREFMQSILDRKGNYHGGNFKGYKGNGQKGKNLVFDQTISEACQYFDELRSWVNDNLNSDNKPDKPLQRQFILSQIPVIYQAWRKYKADERLQSYSDMIASVYESIHGPLCDKLRQSYCLGIIDEFQDTNQMQWKIFSKLFMQSKENPDHQLIVVGDPKQSIYAFQNADVNVYTDATSEKNFSERYLLGTNYRSTDSIIKACNELFKCKACNELFKCNDTLPGFFNSAYQQDKATNTGITFEQSKCPADANNKKRETRLEGEIVPAVWLSEKDISSDMFAFDAIQIILQCSKRVNGKTRLQVFDKETNELRDVSFRDFAILAQSSSEMEPIKKALSKAGIPYLRYKEGNLFRSRECVAWIALCKAIHATDFSEKNRKLLTEVLITDFFHVDLKDAENSRYDSPLCPERINIVKFQNLAKQRKWAAMLECIYQQTGVQDRLSDFTHLQELARLRQIGQYIVDRLYTQHCDLEDIIRHLQKLYQNSKATEDENANLVARNSDFDVVQVMTIHASKGLEFPVVISVAGFKGFNQSQTNASYLYHGKDNKKYLGISEDAKKLYFAEQYLEWQRLFYVAYTRASSLLVLPRYSYTKKDSKVKDEFVFLHNTMKNIEKILEENKLFTEYRLNEKVLKNCWNEPVEVQEILPIGLKEESSTPEEQEKQVQSLKSTVPSRGLYQHSYSSLANKSNRLNDANPKDADNPVYEAEDDFQPKGLDDADDSIEEKDALIASQPQVECFDKGISIKCDYSSQKHADSYEGYPCGTKLGTAVHEVFERIDFADSRTEIPDQCKEIQDQAKRSFIRAGLSVSEKVLTQTTQIVWNTLHADLPVIHGGNPGEGSFKLCELETNMHFPEVEFELNADESTHLLKAYTTGSIDLMFLRDGRYSIVDWKTNRMTPETLCDAESIKNNVDEHYAIQRVLYSYCLIKWLRSFPQFSNKSEEDIFRDHFGGIYYVYVRGCCADTGNGIYAHTWESFKELQASYDKIKKLMTLPKA